MNESEGVLERELKHPVSARLSTLHWGVDGHGSSAAHGAAGRVRSRPMAMRWRQRRLSSRSMGTFVEAARLPRRRVLFGVPHRLRPPPLHPHRQRRARRERRLRHPGPVVRGRGPGRGTGPSDFGSCPEGTGLANRVRIWILFATETFAHEHCRQRNESDAATALPLGQLAPLHRHRHRRDGGIGRCRHCAARVAIHLGPCPFREGQGLLSRGGVRGLLMSVH